MRRRDFLKAVPVVVGAVLLPAFATPLQKASFRGKAFYVEPEKFTITFTNIPDNCQGIDVVWDRDENGHPVGEPIVTYL